MNKKILVGCVLLFMLVTIPLVSAINQEVNIEKKDSPLYRIRTRLAINEKISNIVENIKTKFLCERIFFLPFRAINKNAFWDSTDWGTTNLFCFKVHSFIFGQWCTEAGPTCVVETCDWNGGCFTSSCKV